MTLGFGSLFSFVFRLARSCPTAVTHGSLASCVQAARKKIEAEAAAAAAAAEKIRLKETLKAQKAMEREEEKAARLAQKLAQKEVRCTSRTLLLCPNDGFVCFPPVDYGNPCTGTGLHIRSSLYWPVLARSSLLHRLCLTIPCGQERKRQKAEAKIQKTIAQKQKEMEAMEAEEKAEMAAAEKKRKLAATRKRKAAEKAAVEEQPMTRELRSILEALVT